ncbi:MAG: hypothetical protein KME10_27680 [Plectolyngbya sp. WJT66-NPBG17]|jgi:crotonobetainyl-CoA:carnitine CoA-transferase CaiB-like acyl-CoA transferase|nr:hypothetical protein [Plectolyngbya sp. WJT66-NPBG17]
MSDLFINEGSASAAENSIISMGQTSVELLQYLIAEMKRRQAEEELRRQEEQQRQEEQSQPEASEEAISETLEFSADALMADLERKTVVATAVSVLEEFGQGDRYQSEGFTIKTSYENAQQIYTVRDQDFNEVLRFEKLGEDILVIEDNTTEEQKAEFLKVGENLAESGAEALNRDPTSQTQLEKLGDLAPAGSKAVFVANFVLNQTGQEAYRSQTPEGQADRYSFSRNEQGEVTIHDHYEGYDIVQMRDGKILQALSQENAQHFQALYEKVKDADLAPPRDPNLSVESPERDRVTPSESQPFQSRQATRDRVVEERTQTIDREIELEAPPELEPKPPAPTPAELSEWLLASKVLGRGEAQVQHIKKLGREGAEGTGKDFKDLYREAANEPLPIELSPADYEQMQKDLRQFRDLVKERGAAGVAQIYQVQTHSENPVNIKDNSQIQFKSETANAVRSTAKKIDLER